MSNLGLLFGLQFGNAGPQVPHHVCARMLLDGPQVGHHINAQVPPQLVLDKLIISSSLVGCSK